MTDPLHPLDDYVAELYSQAKGGLGLLDIWAVIDELLQIRHNIKIPEFVMDGDAFTKAVKEAKDDR
jgi:hypothetical protein